GDPPAHALDNLWIEASTLESVLLEPRLEPDLLALGHSGISVSLGRHGDRLVGDHSQPRHHRTQRAELERSPAIDNPLAPFACPLEFKKAFTDDQLQEVDKGFIIALLGC